MKYIVKNTSTFKKDYKRAIKRGLDMDRLHKAVGLLSNGEALPATMRDHELAGKWIRHRECHLAPDWLLIYTIQNDVLVLELTRTGSHADLFE